MSIVRPVDFEFGAIDYTLFIGLLCTSFGIGVYFSCLKPEKKRRIMDPDNPYKETSEFLYAHKTMTVFPVAASLISSFVSGITILGTPTEIYNFGTQYMCIVFGILLMGVVVAYIYLPLFYHLPILSMYEYLELRFHSRIRTMISVLFVIDELLFLPIVLYIPCLAFNQVTGINMYIIAVSVTIVCVFYTSLGGIRAIVWIDLWQAALMFVSEFVLVGWGIIDAGGLGEVWRKNLEGGRIIFENTKFSLLDRTSVWTIVIGGFFYWTAYNAIHQTMVPRYKTLRTMKEARLALAYFTLGVIFFVTACSVCGMLAYAKFHGCDPISAKKIVADDQILLSYIMHLVTNVPGVTGVFIAGVFGAALSSLAVVLNSTSAVILEDFIKVFSNVRLTDLQAKIFTKIVVVVLGCMTIGLMMIVEKIGYILAAATSLSAIAAGTMFGVFTLGMFFPCANHYGALIGGIVGALTASWVSFGGNYVIFMGYFTPEKLPVHVDMCPMNVTITETHYPDPDEVFVLYRIAYFWITPIGIITVLIVGLIVSFMTKKFVTKPVNRKYLAPCVLRFMKNPVTKSEDEVGARSENYLLQRSSNSN